MVFRYPEFDLPPNIIIHERGSSPMQMRNNRKSIEESYIDRSPRIGRSLNDSPVNISLTNSNQSGTAPRIPVYYTEPASEPTKHRVVDRYKQTRVITRRDDDRYFDKLN